MLGLAYMSVSCVHKNQEEGPFTPGSSLILSDKDPRPS
jgi:hypothetical protein